MPFPVYSYTSCQIPVWHHVPDMTPRASIYCVISSTSYQSAVREGFTALPARIGYTRIIGMWRICMVFLYALRYSLAIVFKHPSVSRYWHAVYTTYNNSVAMVCTSYTASTIWYQISARRRIARAVFLQWCTGNRINANGNGNLSDLAKCGNCSPKPEPWNLVRSLSGGGGHAYCPLLPKAHVHTFIFFSCNF